MGNLNILLPRRDLSPKEKGQLVDKLLNCPTMKNGDVRNMVVQELSFASSISRHAVDKVDVMNIVNTCLNHEGGLHALVEVIEILEENSLPMQQLQKLLKTLLSLPQPIAINLDLFGELTELTAHVHVAEDELYRMYSRSKAPGWSSPKTQSDDEVEALSLMLRELARMGQQSNRTHPLLKFVQLLLRHIPEQAVREALVQWLEKTAQQENIVLEKETIGDTSTKQSSEASFYLLVTFKPNCDRQDNEPEDFYIHAWFLREQDGEIVYFDDVFDDVNGKEEVYTLKKIPSLLDNLILQCEEKILQSGQYTNMFTIELFLPFALLHPEHGDTSDVHQWMLVDESGNTIAVSQKYPLVVRLYNRTYEGGPRAWLEWKRNWAICKSYKGCIDKTKLRVLKEKYYHKESFISLRQALCLTMTFVPPRFDDTPQHIFKKMMSAGTSVALWPRSKAGSFDEEAAEEAYQALLSGCDFSKLPKTIWERRIENKTSLANRLTLFWDDPNRLPLDAPCKAPLVAPKKGNAR